MFDAALVKQKANGMIAVDTYRKIYELCRELKPNGVIEVGTAHGASAITMARAAIDEPYSSSIVTIDPLQGRLTSRSRFGSAADNESIIKKNFVEFGVDKIVQLFVGTLEEINKTNTMKLPKADLVCLDADGRLDRDLLGLLPQIHAETNFIIDDCSFFPKISIGFDQTKWIDLKHCITKRLVEHLVDEGALRIKEKSGETLFACVNDFSVWNKKMLHSISLKAYREIVFIELDPDSIGRMRDGLTDGNAQLSNKLYAKVGRRLAQLFK